MEISTNEKHRTIRNLVIFAAVVASCGFIGIALDRLVPPADPMQGLGALVWLVSPLLSVLVLRALGGDGWKDFGLGPNLKSSWGWYLAALAIIPVVTIITLGAGCLAGGVSLSGFSEQGFGAFLPLVAAGFAGALAKNIFEEFAWRGYLTPRFAALGLGPLASSILTGFIWASWHVPYYLYFLDRSVLQAHTTLSIPVFILMAFLLLPFHAFAFGELRLVSKSVWPVWLLHNAANAISLPLLSNSFATLTGGFMGVFLSPGTEGILFSGLVGLVGYGLYRYRVSRRSEDVKKGDLAFKNLPG